MSLKARPRTTATPLSFPISQPAPKVTARQKQKGYRFSASLQILPELPETGFVYSYVLMPLLSIQCACAGSFLCSSL